MFRPHLPYGHCTGLDTYAHDADEVVIEETHEENPARGADDVASASTSWSPLTTRSGTPNCWFG